ncbi:MAG TPA: NADH-quinone oxidoreductase subunit L [Chloroflexota bacterium]|nr:NADH-quinone oxidoreductase subunit L [Chloroflexota bacterium]
MAEVAWAIPLCPLVAFVIISLGARRSPGFSAALSIVAVAVSLVLAVGVIADVLAGGHVEQSRVWIPAPAIAGPIVPLNAAALQSGAAPQPFSIGFQVDALTAVMLLVVTSISFVVQIYSLGYMRGDSGFARYYAFLSLFSMSMLGLVLANNFLALFVFWELVGLCSYLLIGHWHERPAAAEAAKKAFIVTRAGDVGLLLGVLFLYWHAGTFAFGDIAQMAADGRIPAGALTVGILLVFCGAVGKSAQFPLHVWLPDAMEGPTPVSALIHAATMVAAGVYLMARTFPILEHSSTAMAVVATIGGFTAFFAATMGLVSTDIKRVLAYSTVSQLGYMMLAIGIGAMSAGVFHLFNHAFFKALLFLCAGSVIHLVETNEMFEMGGLGRRLPLTTITMTIAALSLAGLPPLSGFWSKDEILGAALAGHPILFVLALATVGMTAFYMFRVIFLTFSGSFRGTGHVESHGEPISMALSLVILVIPSIISGFWGMPFAGNPFGRLVSGSAESTGFHPVVATSSVIVALLGIGIAWVMYGGGRIEAGAGLSARIAPLHQLLIRRYYLDDLYEWLVARVFLGIGRLAATFDAEVIDGAVNGTGALTVLIGGSLRRIQTGQVQTYAWALFAGILVLAVLLAGLRLER